MLKLAKFYTKLFIKTPIFILSLIFSLFIFIVQINALKYSSILQYTGVICYGIMSYNLFFIVSSASIISHNNDIFEFLQENKYKKFLVIIFSGLIVSVIMSLIPIIFVMLFKNSNINTFFTLKGILNIFIIINLSNLLSITIGSSIGLLFNKWISIICSLIIYCIFAINLFFPILNFSSFSKLINIYSDYTVIQKNILCDDLINTFYICDKLFILCIIFLIIVFTKIFLDKKKVFKSIISFFIILIITIGIVFVGINSVKTFHTYDVIDLTNYSIEDYNMSLCINNKLKNDVLLKLKVSNSSDKIELLLDDIFKINDIKINNSPVTYNHSDNKIVLNYNSNSGESVYINISYEGFVNIEDYLGVNIFYCNKNCINLTDSFYWYPSLYDNSLVNYNVTLNTTSSKVYSNLNIISEKDSFLSNEYTFEGTVPNFNLFSGQYNDVYDNEIEYVIPSSYRLEHFEKRLDSIVSSYLASNFAHLSETEKYMLENKKYKKVIICMGVSNGLKLSNDTLLINL